MQDKNKEERETRQIDTFTAIAKHFLAISL